MSSQSSFWWSQIGSAFLRMNSSASIPSIVGGRFTRFCFPLTKMVMYSRLRRFFSAFSLAVSFRFAFAMVQKPVLQKTHYRLSAIILCILFAPWRLPGEFRARLNREAAKDARRRKGLWGAPRSPSRRRSEIFVPLKISRRAADHHHVQAAVAVDVRDGATGSRHLLGIDHTVQPRNAACVLSVEEVDAAAPAPRAVAGDNVLEAVSVEVTHANLVAFHEPVENHSPLPSVRIVLRVDDDLVSMPGLDRSEKPPFPQPPHGHIARSRSRRPLLVPLRQQSVLPLQRAARADRPVEHDPVEPRGQELLTPIAVPLDDANPVQDTVE